MLGFSDQEWQAIGLSLEVAAWCTVVVLPPAIAVAHILARRHFAGKTLLDVIVLLPLVVPPIVTGYVLLLLLGRNGPIGRVLFAWFGLQFVFRWTGAVIASAIMAFPLAVRAIRVAIEAVDPALEQAARGLGAGRWRVFWAVTLPLAMPGILAGGVLAFARSLGEFGATITFVSNIPGETQTVPSAIAAYLQTPNGDEPAFRLTLISIAIAFLALVVAEIFARRMTWRTRTRQASSG